MKKLVTFVLLILLFFSSLEIIVRTNKDTFYALSDKLLLKLEMLKKRKNDQVVVFGSSRTLDAISASTMEKTFNQSYQKKIKVFNNGSTGQNFKRVNYVLENLLKSDDIEMIVIEASPVGFVKGELGFEITPIESKDPIEENKSIEDKIINFLNLKSFLLKTRKAFKIKTLTRIIMLWICDFYHQDLWFRSGVFREIFSGIYKEYNDFSLLTPEIIKPKKEENLILKDTDLKKPIYRIAQSLKDTKKKIVFYTPPLNKESSLVDCSDSRNELYQKISNLFKVNFINYSCHSFPKKWLRDSTHLNPNGRVFFSQALAHDLMKLEGDFLNAL